MKRALGQSLSLATAESLPEWRIPCYSVLRRIKSAFEGKTKASKSPPLSPSKCGLGGEGCFL